MRASSARSLAIRQSAAAFRVALLGVAALLLASSTLFGIADGPFEVKVHCDALRGRQGVSLRILRSSLLGVIAMPSINATFNDQGECRVELPAGEFIFEANKVGSNLMIALRTPPRRITSATVVEMKAADPEPLTVKYRDDQTLPVQEIAIRSAAVTGEFTWTEGSNLPPQMLLSPGQQYRVRVLGGDERTRFALWQQMSSTQLNVLLQAKDVCRCKFNVRQDGPKIAKARVQFQFPDGSMRFPVDSESVFLTNRRFVSFGYAVELSNGRLVRFRPWLGLVKDNQEFVLGGPLTPTAWAKIMVRKPVGGPETHHLVWDANLYDPRGHMVLNDGSQIDWKDSIRTASGATVPHGRPVDKADVAAFLASGDSLVVNVSYHLEESVSTTLRPSQFRPFGSKRFHTKAPPNWELQAINYLARAERVFHMIEDLEGKPSKHRVEVRWHDMGGTAWGCAPAGGNAYIMMPFSGLKGSFNYYESPWALSHEMLHTFGYGHDEKMSRMTTLVDRRFDQYRWFMADHPQQDPETAFVGFRVATRMAPGAVDLANKIKKKAKGKGKK